MGDEMFCLYHVFKFSSLAQSVFIASPTWIEWWKKINPMQSGSPRPNANLWRYIYTWISENRVSEDKGSFYYLAIKSNKIRPKADKKAYIWRRAVS